MSDPANPTGPPRDAATATAAVPARWTPRQKVVLLVEVLGIYARVRVWLWRSDLPAVVARLRRLSSRAPVAQDSAWVWRRYGQATVRTLEALPADSRCLMRALTLLAVLARRGVDTQLIVGVSTAGGFRAHAWIERGGRALLWPGDGYSRLLEL